MPAWLFAWPAGVRIDYGLLNAALIWYVQVGALVAGHVSGLALAHDRALVLYGGPHAAADSRRWMLVVDGEHMSGLGLIP